MPGWNSTTSNYQGVQVSEQPKGAILQRDKETYAIVPRTPVGLVTPEILEGMARVVRKYNIPIVKITSGQRMALVGMPSEAVETIWQELQMDVGPAIELCVHYVQACPGTAVCRFGVQDSLGLGLELEKLFVGPDTEFPAKVKMGISGCPLCCGESWVRDFGAVGGKSGWTVIVGGNSGGRPRIGDLLAEGLSREQVIGTAQRFLEFYKSQGKKKERTARFLERFGIDAVKEAVL
jgi:NAD(P)H-nitrite reductase large subunit